MQAKGKLFQPSPQIMGRVQYIQTPLFFGFGNTAFLLCSFSDHFFHQFPHGQVFRYGLQFQFFVNVFADFHGYVFQFFFLGFVFYCCCHFVLLFRLLLSSISNLYWDYHLNLQQRHGLFSSLCIFN